MSGSQHETGLVPRPRTGRISVVIAVRNEERSLPELYRRLSTVLDEVGLDWEVVFVEDSSTDATVAVLRELGTRDQRIKSLSLSRGFTHHVAITAGLDVATGDHFVLMDGDLQHRPEDIPRLLGPYFEGYEVVYGKRTTRQTWLKELGSRFINALVNRLSDHPVDLNSGMFRVFSAAVNQHLRRMRERARFLVGMIAWLGFSTTAVPIAEDVRAYGESKYDLGRMLQLAINYVISFSTKPLRLASYLGFLSALLSILLGAYYLVAALIWGTPVTGWPTLVVTGSFLGGLILFVLGIMGEYVGGIYIQQQGRPMYVIESALNLDLDQLP